MELIRIVHRLRGIFNPKKEKIRSQASSAEMPEHTHNNICENFSFFIIKIKIIIPAIVNSKKNKLILSPDNVYEIKTIVMLKNFDCLR